MRKLIRTILTLIVFSSVLSCTHKSVFEVKGPQSQSRMFQYCGGQQWGYAQKLSSDKQGPYLLVYFESQFLKEGDSIIANIVLHSITDTNFKLNGKDIQIFRDGKQVPDSKPNFWILRTEKRIDERYPNTDYRVQYVQGSDNEWTVRKLKYGGFFGVMAVEDPFTVKIEKYPNEEVKAESGDVRLDREKMNAILLVKQTVALFDKDRPQTSHIEVRLPKFEINGISVSEKTFTLNYDRERLANATKNASRCASLNEITRWERLDGSGWSFSSPQIL